MNTANLELCKELYELSGWVCKGYQTGFVGDDRTLGSGFAEFECPYAYDLGYLLRKLPTYSQVKSLKGDVPWIASYDNGVSTRNCLAGTPEDAACLLAIELFKQGIL